VPEASCAGTVPPPDGEGRAGHVFVITIDGMRPELIDAADAPTLSSLLPVAARSLDARTVRPVKTLPAHVSMVTGLTPERHGVLWNRWRPGRGPIDARTIFDAARDAGLESALIAGKKKLRHLARPGAPTIVSAEERGDREVMDAALAVVRERRPSLMLIHLPDVDRAGHRSGWLGTAQREAMRRADGEVRRLLDTLAQTGLAADSALIVTADHGGEGTRHAPGAPADLRVPWLAWGQGVAPGEVGKVCVTATGQLAARLLGLRLGSAQRSTSTSSP